MSEQNNLPTPRSRALQDSPDRYHSVYGIKYINGTPQEGYHRPAKGNRLLEHFTISREHRSELFGFLEGEERKKASEYLYIIHMLNHTAADENGWRWLEASWFHYIISASRVKMILKRLEDEGMIAGESRTGFTPANPSRGYKFVTDFERNKYPVQDWFAEHLKSKKRSKRRRD